MTTSNTALGYRKTPLPPNGKTLKHRNLRLRVGLPAAQGSRRRFHRRPAPGAPPDPGPGPQPVPLPGASNPPAWPVLALPVPPRGGRELPESKPATPREAAPSGEPSDESSSLLGWFRFFNGESILCPQPPIPNHNSIYKNPKKLLETCFYFTGAVIQSPSRNRGCPDTCTPVMTLHSVSCPNNNPESGCSRANSHADVSTAFDHDSARELQVFHSSGFYKGQIIADTVFCCKSHKNVYSKFGIKKIKS